MVFIIVILLVVLIAVYLINSRKKLNKTIADNINKQIFTERNQKWRANSETEKFKELSNEEYHERIKAAIEIENIGDLVEKSVYQESEKDWAILGGLANGIAGPAAGLITASNAINENEKIRQRNAENREWAKQQSQKFKELATMSFSDGIHKLEDWELDKMVKFDTSKSETELFSLLDISSRIQIDEITGAITVYADIKSNTIDCIDGSLEACIYSEDGEQVGSAYIILPKFGTYGIDGEISGICAQPSQKSKKYTVKMKPYKLWIMVDTTHENIITFGNYNERNIDWFVLEEKENEALVISKRPVDLKQYNEEGCNINGQLPDGNILSWETCSLRKWLNEDFLNEAFSKTEKSKIKQTEVVTLPNQKEHKSNGCTTKDYLFLLSLDEAEKYFKTDKLRKTVSYEHLESMNIFNVKVKKGILSPLLSSRFVKYKTSSWYLRSDSDSSYSYGAPEYVGYTGLLQDESSPEEFRGVRPAMWIKTK